MNNILIADDHSIVRFGITVAINDAFKHADITHASTIKEVYSHLNFKKYDLILLDINMPGGNNINVIKEILKLQTDVKILIFSSYDENIYALRYIEAGAAGYLNKNTAVEELSNAISTILENGKYMSETVRDLYIQKLTSTKASIDQVNPLHKLSNREMDVAKHLIEGLGILEVSNKLNLSSSTVSTYKSRIFEKLSVTNIPDLIELFKLHAQD